MAEPIPYDTVFVCTGTGVAPFIAMLGHIPGAVGIPDSEASSIPNRARRIPSNATAKAGSS